MAVKIRLKRMGKIRTPFYRIVVADSRGKRDGRAIEEIGTYNPKADPSVISVVSDRAQYWLSVGAQPTEAVVALLKLTGDWEKFSGEKQERKLEIAEPKRDKAEIFDEALKDLHAGEAKAEATTKKAAAAKKAEKKADEPKADEKPAEAKADKKADKPAEAKAEKKADKPAEPKAEKKADAPKADKPAEAKADEKPAEAKAEKKADAPKADKPAEAKADEPKADKPAADETKA